MILWLDVETTGLDPDRDALLEVGALVTDPQDRVISTFESVLSYTPDVVGRLSAECDPYVFNMHDKSGLWLRLLQAPLSTPAELEASLCAWLRGLVLDAKRVPLGGFSPHFDARWLRRYAPALLQLISHRVFDASTFRAAVRMRYGEGDWGPSQPTVEHRALADCYAALTYWKWFRRQVMIPYAGSLTRHVERPEGS